MRLNAGRYNIFTIPINNSLSHLISLPSSASTISNSIGHDESARIDQAGLLAKVNSGGNSQIEVACDPRVSSSSADCHAKCEVEAVRDDIWRLSHCLGPQDAVRVSGVRQKSDVQNTRHILCHRRLVLPGPRGQQGAINIQI